MHAGGNQLKDEPGCSSDASVIGTVSVAELLERANLSSIAPSLSDAGWDDDSIALIIAELNQDWDSGATFLHELLQEADLTDKAIPGQLLGALRGKALSQPRSALEADSQSALEADTERLCRSLGDEVAEDSQSALEADSQSALEADICRSLAEEVAETPPKVQHPAPAVSVYECMLAGSGVGYRKTPGDTAASPVVRLIEHVLEFGDKQPRTVRGPKKGQCIIADALSQGK